MSRKYNHKQIEQKWQKQWEEDGLYCISEPSSPSQGTQKKKYYVLDMFPYPSGEGLHVGHPKGYIGTDVHARYKRMKGFNVLRPMGWDAFGLPAENYALKNKVHPREAVEKNIQRFKDQLAIIGFSYDWEREINTTDPEYYKWTQWIFLQLYKKGLAYITDEPINWCPSCLTGLANEDLEDGKCERCGSNVEKKPIRQWVLRITDYAEELLEGLDDLPWPQHVKDMQRNWIGKSEGLIFKAKVKDLDLELETFSAHYEGAYADTFVVIASDHPMLTDLIADTPTHDEIQEEVDSINIKRRSGGYEGVDNPEGVFTGRYLEDPLTGEDLPIWVASYAIADYGTGIVKCSAHDVRDFAFAKKYSISLKPVMFPRDEKERTKVENLEECYSNYQGGILTEPKEFAGRIVDESLLSDITEHFVKKNYARKQVMYRLNDWVFSRQRYWGEPIPMLFCKNCWDRLDEKARKQLHFRSDYIDIGDDYYRIIPVEESALPVELPEVKHYEPTGTGESPLAHIHDWVEVKCPDCGEKARRETNTMPQWAGSSWYYLRYMDPKNSDVFVDPNNEKYWSPVDMYVGGLEHVTRHIIYARFWHKVLFDSGVLSNEEPFLEFQNVGLIAGEDGRKMSKRWGNVINPDDVIEQFGADSFRIYEMFMGPFNDGATWNTDSIMGPRRFVERLWKLSERVVEEAEIDSQSTLTKKLHQAISKVGSDYEKFRFNTAVSTLMSLLKSFESEEQIPRDLFDQFLILTAPLAPHVTEELWQDSKSRASIHLADWPDFDEQVARDDFVTIAVQVNGKVRATLLVSPDANEDAIKGLALEVDAVKKWLAGKSNDDCRYIYVPGRILNIVVQ